MGEPTVDLTPIIRGRATTSPCPGARVRLHLFGDRLALYVPGALANTLAPDSLHLRQPNRNELIVSLLARCPSPSGVGRARLMDRRT